MTLTVPAGGRALIIAGPPTANGDLHVGHVAGPYVGADVHTRYLRAAGRDVVFASCTDDYQTYVVTTAARLGTTPAELVARSTADIQATFAAMGIALDGFSATDDGYRAAVYDYVGGLAAAGALRVRSVRLPYSERTGTFCVEGLVGGGCPTCLADSRGGFCESCGHPIDFDGLLEPYSVLDRDDDLSYRETEIMVFPLEPYRDQLAAYYQAHAPRWRPRLVALTRELLARPLPDYPITYPVNWGLPAPFPETPGQRLNAWVEGMPASMYCTAYAARPPGGPPARYDEAWLAGHGAEPVVFMGFDPLYVWALVHVAELMAHGRYTLPADFRCNEFYELDNEPFSTSKGHVVWARDLVSEVPRDIVRFYLALTAPEHARTNFSRAALERVARARLVEPWNDLAATLATLTAGAGADVAALPVPPGARERAGAMVARFRLCYERDSFSLTQAADLVVAHTGRLRDRARRAAIAPAADAEVLGDLFLQLRALISAAAPILIDLAAACASAGGFEPRLAEGGFGETAVTAFRVPELRLSTAPVGDTGPSLSPTTER